MNVTEMKMLKLMCGKTKKHRIRNDIFREYLGVAAIGHKIRETRLIWFGHVQRRPVTASVMKIFAMKVDSPSKERGRSTRTWIEIVKMNMSKYNLSENLVQDRSEWRSRICVDRNGQR